MKKVLSYIFFIVIAIILVTVAISNSTMTTVKLLPDWFPIFGGWGITLPLFVHLYIALFAGLGFGFFIEYLRESRYRREARKARKALKKSEKELSKTKSDAGQHDDEVLAIVEG